MSEMSKRLIMIRFIQFYLTKKKGLYSFIDKTNKVNNYKLEMRYLADYKMLDLVYGSDIVL